MKKEVKIGIFAFLMLLLLYWGINFLKGKNLFSSSHTFYTTFRDVDGLNVSGDVMFRGMKVGTITDIVFNPKTPETIVVEFTMPRKYPVPDDSRVSTSNPFIIGNKIMVIEYGNSPRMYQSGDTIPSVAKPELLSQVSDALGPVKEQIADLVSSLNRTLGNLDTLFSEQNLQNISGTLANIRMLSSKLDTSMENVSAITGNLKDNSGNINRIIGNVGDFTDTLSQLQLTGMIEKLHSTVDGLNEAVAKINEGDGSLGLLLNDPALYEGLQSSSENLSILLEDLKANPGRYVHFSLFGRRNK